jgi:CubicO group peptidase (beta-lactamase class C family)
MVHFLSLSPAILLAAGLAMQTQRPSEPYETPLQEIERTLSTAEARGFSGLILLRAGERQLLAKAYGWADRQARKRMTMETGIEIGSIVKPLTLAALLRLEEMGKLSIQDTLAEHFANVLQDKRAITLEMVARHRAGFPDLFGGDYQLVDRDWVVGKVLGSRLIAHPGEREKYSNSGYSLLAAIIELKSGMPYETFVRQEVLEPAGVLRIGYRLAGWSNADLAVGYRRFGLRWGTPLDHAWMQDGPGWNLRGNGGMLATAADLSTWYSALRGGRVLGGKALSQFMAIDASESKLVGGKVMVHAGGNGIFNCLQVCYCAPEVYLTLFSSVANHKAELLWKLIRDAVVAIAKF